MSERLLLVEDDDAIAGVLCTHLEEAGYEVRWEADGLEAIGAIDAHAWDLVLLDVMLPGRDGWQLCRHLRSRHPNVPVIMLTARSAEADLLKGLDLGADDYIAKPFSMLELVARVRALLRRVEQMRVNTVSTADNVRFGAFRLDAVRRELTRDREVIPLTLREYELLLYLAHHPGQALSRQELLENVWGDAFDGYEHTVNSHINRLRMKIEDNPREPRHVVTVWGMGYRFDGLVMA